MGYLVRLWRVMSKGFSWGEEREVSKMGEIKGGGGGGVNLRWNKW